MDQSRIGCITSSEIYQLLSMGKRDMTDAELAEYKIANPKSRAKTIETWPGEAAVKYILDTKREQRIGRSLDNESSARPLLWGNLVEPYAFDQLGMEYIYSSQETINHPFIKRYKGTPDGKKEDEGGTTVEMKCPWTITSFCQLIEPLYEGLTGMDAMNALRDGYRDKDGLWHKPHADGEKFYQQCISNSILQKTKHCELVIFLPYYSQLQDIMDLANQKDGFEASKYYFVANAVDGDLPSIPDDGFYKNLNIIRFDPPEQDKSHMITIIKKAEKYL